MALTAVRVPRLNANDDVVKIVGLNASTGDRLEAGATIAEVETLKAVVPIVVEETAFVLRIDAELGTMVPVGQVIAWLGSEPGLEVPTPKAGGATTARPQRLEPTAKARAVLEAHGLRADQVPSTGDRLTAADVEAFVKSTQHAPPDSSRRPVSSPPQDLSPGESIAMTSSQRAMIATLEWQKREASPAYLEVPFDAAGWRAYADAFREARKTLMDPLLPLIAHRLVVACRETPILNSTIRDGSLYQYASVNLGFTAKTADKLVLLVVRDANTLEEAEFVAALGKLMRSAFAGKLAPAQVTGATTAFTSLASAGALRHTPILPPYCSLIVAHAAQDAAGTAVLGASYDHRVLDGALVAETLNLIARPQP